MQENQWLADAKANFMWEFAQIAAFARDPSIFEAYDYHGDGIGSYEPEAPYELTGDGCGDGDGGGDGNGDAQPDWYTPNPPAFRI